VQPDRDLQQHSELHFLLTDGSGVRVTLYTIILGDRPDFQSHYEFLGDGNNKYKRTLYLKFRKTNQVVIGVYFA
jgi:hypothetical protein